MTGSCLLCPLKINSPSKTLCIPVVFVLSILCIVPSSLQKQCAQLKVLCVCTLLTLWLRACFVIDVVMGAVDLVVLCTQRMYIHMLLQYACMHAYKCVMYYTMQVDIIAG